MAIACSHVGIFSRVPSALQHQHVRIPCALLARLYTGLTTLDRVEQLQPRMRMRTFTRTAAGSQSSRSAGVLVYAVGFLVAALVLVLAYTEYRIIDKEQFERLDFEFGEDLWQKQDPEARPGLLVGFLHELLGCVERNESIMAVPDLGTLLGAVRNESLLLWDHDIDLLVHEDSFRPLVKLLQDCLPSAKYETVVRQAWRIFGGEVLVVAHKHNGLRADIQQFEDDPANGVVVRKLAPFLLRRLPAVIGAFVSDSDYSNMYIARASVLPLRRGAGMLNGHKVSLPNDPEALLENYYGPHWREPRVRDEGSLQVWGLVTGQKCNATCLERYREGMKSDRRLIDAP